MRPRAPSLLSLLKRRAPTSLYGRSLLIIVLPIAIMQILVTWFFFDQYWQRVNGHLTEGLAGDIAWVLQGYDADPTPAGLKRLSDRAEQSLDLSIIYQPGAKLPTVRHAAMFGIDRAMNTALSDRIDAPYWFDTTRYPAYVDIRVKVTDGVLRIIAPRDRAFATQAYSFIFWLTLATVLLTAVAILFIRNQVRAIERLAAAAEAFGKGADIAFKPHGAKEVRQAAQAFIAMKNRIQRHVDQRTTLLASVSHDLRTPLTRLKLELAAHATPAGGVEIIVDDDGPGIPPDRFEEAFTPFGRLDESRNQNEKGVGLGLAIARDVARGHGGEVTLDRSPLGGLRAVIRLPG